MADYYPLISRAVAGLEQNTGENRRVLYERARTALVNQLRGVEPALEEADITRERWRSRRRSARSRRKPRTRPKPPSCRRAGAAAGRGDAPGRATGARRAAPAAAFAARSRPARFPRLGGGGRGPGRGGERSQPRGAHERFDVVSGEIGGLRRRPSEPRGAEAAPTTHYFEPPGESAQADSLQFAPASAEHAEEPLAEPASTMPPPPVFDEPEEEGAIGRCAPMAAWSRSWCSSWCWAALPAPATGSATPSPPWWRACAAAAAPSRR